MYGSGAPVDGTWSSAMASTKSMFSILLVELHRLLGVLAAVGDVVDALELQHVSSP
jgi:hypothetical protein